MTRPNGLGTTAPPLGQCPHSGTRASRSRSKTAIIGHHDPLRCSSAFGNHVDDHVVCSLSCRVANRHPAEVLGLRRALGRRTVEDDNDLQGLMADQFQRALSDFGATPMGARETVKEVVAIDDDGHIQCIWRARRNRRCSSRAPANSLYIRLAASLSGSNARARSRLFRCRST
jgi:hypothetical protein